jgi:hypothetical protein
MGNWELEWGSRLFRYFGLKGAEVKRLLASRALSGWNDVHVRPKNPEFVLCSVFTVQVVERMILYAYGEHVSDMGTIS